ELRGQGQAREDRNAVDQHRAGAALAELAAVLRAGELELLAQHFEQGVVRLGGDGVALAVDHEAQQLLRHATASRRRTCADSAAASGPQGSPALLRAPK